MKKLLDYDVLVIENELEVVVDIVAQVTIMANNQTGPAPNRTLVPLTPTEPGRRPGNLMRTPEGHASGSKTAQEPFEP